MSEGSAPVLVYVRPWSREQFLHLARGCWPNASLVQTSEHPGEDQSGLKDGLYQLHNGLSEDAAPMHLSDDEIADMILRCRLLRMIQRAEARLLVLACERAVEDVLDRHRPRAVLSVTTDSYVLHMYVLACRRRGIPFVGLVPSFVNGHFRVTALGERVVTREVSDQEIDTVTSQLLATGYTPDFLVKSPRQLQAKARRLWRRNLVKPAYFALRRRLSGDPLNYHSWSTQLVAQRFWSLRLQTYAGATIRDRADLPSDLKGRPVIFLPLQMSPEATIDYWSADTRWIDYEARVLELLEETANSHTILIKEHPNLLGFRTPGFYDRLAQHRNAVFVDAGMPSNALLGMCDGVVICTGTVGFEAALRGIPVYTDSAPFHLPADTARPLSDLRSPAPASYETHEPTALVRHVLQATLQGTFLNDGSWRGDDNAHTEGQNTMISSLRTYLEEAGY